MAEPIEHIKWFLCVYLTKWCLVSILTVVKCTSIKSVKKIRKFALNEKVVDLKLFGSYSSKFIEWIWFHIEDTCVQFVGKWVICN